MYAEFKHRLDVQEEDTRHVYVRLLICDFFRAADC